MRLGRYLKDIVKLDVNENLYGLFFEVVFLFKKVLMGVLILRRVEYCFSMFLRIV